MFMNLTVSSLSMRMDSTIRHTGEASRSGHSILMDVQPQGSNYLELETGEIFCSPDYFRVHGKNRNPISATLFISQAITKSDYEKSQMTYYGEYGSGVDYFPASIYLSCFLRPEEFADLWTDIRSGQIASTVEITFDDKGSGGALKYELGSDGSGKKWNNDKSTGNFRIGIDSIRIFYERSSLSEIAKQTQELTGRLKVIERNVSYYGRLWTIFGFVITVMLFYWIVMRFK